VVIDMDQRIIVLSIVIMTSFMASTTGVFFSLGSDFPERTAEVPQSTEFDTGFWNISEAFLQPLDISNHTTEQVSVDYGGEAIAVSEWRFDYFSEVFRGEEVRINSVLLWRENVTGPSPTMVFLHGYGEAYSDYVPYLREMAAEGIVVLAIDQPGSGDSMGYPELSPNTFLNVTSGPADASLYHSVWAAVRAVTLLEAITIADANATVVAGVSMGGLVTYIVSAIDSRVDGSIPMISGGNFMNSITSGSLLNTVIDPTYSVGSTELSNIVRWFDPLGYTPGLTGPVLMMFGTDDQFFPLISLMDTANSIESDLTLTIVPNWGHFFHPAWPRTIVSWIVTIFEDAGVPSRVDASHVAQMTLWGSGLAITANASNGNNAFVCWRSGEPAAVWSLSRMQDNPEAAPSVFTGWVLPLSIGRTLFFVLVVQEDGSYLCSKVHSAWAGSLLYPVGLLLSSVGVLAIIGRGLWRPSFKVLLRETPYLIGMLLMALGFVLPFLSIPGRVSLSLLGFLEMYGESFLLGGWFLPSIMLSICFVLAISAFRQRFQFRLAATLWVPVLVILAVLYAIFNGVFAYFADLLLIQTGAGGLLLLIGIPLMQILDKAFRDMKAWTELIEDPGEDVSD
jgi:pimeloyl-ACP methyl ester carboxylesterase